MAKTLYDLEEGETKPALHWSMLHSIARCAYQFYLRQMLGQVVPPGLMLPRGLSTHKAVAANLSAKIETGSLLNVEEVRTIAREDFLYEWEHIDIDFNDDEKEIGLKKLKGQSTDLVGDLAVAHHDELADELHPVAVERKWRMICDNYPFDLAGKIDVEEEWKTDPRLTESKIISTVRDTKTAKKDPGQREADASDQLTEYAIARKITRKTAPTFVYIDALLLPTKTMPVRVKRYQSQRDQHDFDAFMKRFAAACQAIEKEVFLPTLQSNWWCDPKYCGYFRRGCPYARQRCGISYAKKKAVK